MAPVDWDELMGLDVANLEGDTADDMYPVLSELQLDDEEVDAEKLKKLFQVTQQVMIVKGVQSELAEEELQKIAQDSSKSGIKREQELRMKVEELEEENRKLKRFGPEEPAGLTKDAKYLREEITELERQIDIFTKDLRERDKELSEEKKISERFIKRAEDAEQEVRDLKKENDHMREDIRDYQRQLESTRETMMTRRVEDQEYKDRMQTKNRDLANAFEEIQNLTDANKEMNKQVEDLKSKLEDATVQMNKMSDEYEKMKSSMGTSDKALDDMRRENEMLKAQKEDLLEQIRSKTDADDEIMVKVNEKVEEWTGVLEAKDLQLRQQHMEINHLKEQLIQANMDSERQSVDALTKALNERDKQIEDLQQKLNTALGEIETTAALAEDVRNELTKGGKGPGDRQQQKINALQGTLRVNESHLKEAEARALEAEADARDKDKQLSEALERMNQYEKGEYGLSEAVGEIKELKNQINVRDRQIEDLTQYINKCELQINDLYDECEELRDRLGLDRKEPIDLTDYKRKKSIRMQEDRALNQVLQKEVERLEEERVELKRNIRKLAQQTGQRAVALGLTAEDMVAIDEFTEGLKVKRQQETASNIIQKAEQSELQIRNVQLDKDLESKEKMLERIGKENAENKAKIKEVEQENKSLVEAMKEINKAMQEQAVGPGADGTDVKYLQCPTLERMLAAIDAKNMVGRYDTTLYLKAQVDNLTGHNEELRKELRESRYEATKANVDLEKASNKVNQLESEVKNLREAGAGGFFQTMPLPEGISVTSADVISSLNEHLVHVLQEVSLKETMLEKMETALDNYRRKFAVMRHQQGLLYQDHLQETKKWDEEREKLESQVKELEGKTQEDGVRLQEFDRLIATLAEDDIEVRRRLSDMTRKITVLRVNEKALTRRYNAMQEVEGSLRKESNRLKNEAVQMETAIGDRLGYLQRYKDMASFQIASLQRALDESVPAQELERANKQYTELTEKYRDLLEKKNSLVVQSEQTSGFEIEAGRLRTENNTLRSELELEKEKLHTFEAAFDQLNKQGFAGKQAMSDSGVLSISKKLTTLEMKELNERQRAEHANRMYEQQKKQLRDLEDRNFELEQKFSDLTKMNLEMQKTERELQDELANCVTKAVSNADRKKIADLEKTESTLKVEVSKLKDIAEVASSQARALEAQQTSRDKEVQSLRQQLVDFQAQSDEKTIIGKLHRHIVQLQVSEGTAVRKLEDAMKKVLKLEAQLLRTEQKVDDKDQTIYHNRLEARNKSRHQQRTIQDMRRKFAGAVPLPRQEKFSEAMLKLQEDKKKMEDDLRETNAERVVIEDKLAAVELQHKGLQDLIVTLKDGRGAQKVAEWHSKMEALRLEELKRKRQIDRLKQQLSFLEGLIKKHEKEVLALEEENVRLNKDFEDRQLDWEHREVELERIIHNMEKQQAEIAGAASQFEEAVGALPDPSMPVAVQLEHAVTTIKRNVKLILDSKAESQAHKKRIEELEKELKASEKEVLQRDRVITDLRLRLPATAERDAIVAKATASTTGSAPSEDDYENRQALKVAQSTVSSLQARIQQKEETLHKYQELLKQARQDMQEMNDRHESELKLMQEKLHSRSDAAFVKFKESALQMISKPGAQVPTNKQLARLNELEDVVAEQDNAMAALQEKLKQVRNDLKDLHHKHDLALKHHQDENYSMLEEQQGQVGALQEEIGRYRAELTDKDKELELVHQELEKQKEANSRAPTTSMKNMVERLKNQLALKEKQHKALSKALMELRADMVNQAQEMVTVNADEAQAEANVQKVIDRTTKELRDQIEDADSQNLKLKKELKKRREKEATAVAELEETKQELARKEGQLKKSKEDRARLEGEVEELEKKVERMSTMRQQRGDLNAARQEAEELKRKMRLMEEEMRRNKHRPEKPYDQQQPTEKQGDEVVARWEESKKWQKTVDRLKTKVKDRDVEIDKLHKNNEMLKNALDRAQKDSQPKVFKAAPPEGPIVAARMGLTSAALPPQATHDLQDLRRKNYQLEEEIAALKRQLTIGQNSAFEEVQLRNKFLAEKLETMEKQFALRSAGGTEHLPATMGKEDKLQREVIRLSEENIELKFEVEQSRKDIPRLKDRIEDLQKYVDILKAEKEQLRTHKSWESSFGSPTSSNIRRIGESGKSSKELERTIALLKKVVERVQSENEQLKKAPGVASSDHVRMLQQENAGLKTQLEDLRQKVGANLTDRYNSTQKGTVKMMADYEKQRRDLIKEKESNEHLRVTARQLEISHGQVVKELDDTKRKLEISEAKQPSMSSMDTKGWKSVVVTRMYEEKVKALTEDLEKKNKSLADTRVLLRDAAEREQALLRDNTDLKKKVEILERFPPGGSTKDPDTNRELQLARLKVDRLECEKAELVQEVQVLRREFNAAAGTAADVGSDDVVEKITNYDRMMTENVDLHMQLKAAEMERDKLEREVDKLKAELSNFGPEFFEEIEDLKFNYRDAVQKNVQYESQLENISKQFGIDVKVPGL